MSKEALPAIEKLESIFYELLKEEVEDHEWKKILNQKLPNWEELLVKEECLPKIDELSRKNGKLAYFFLTVLGMKMALKWLESGSYIQKKAAKEWLDNRPSYKLRELSEYWESLSRETKNWFATEHPHVVLNFLDENIWNELNRVSKQSIILSMFESFSFDFSDIAREIERAIVGDLDYFLYRLRKLSFREKGSSEIHRIIDWIFGISAAYSIFSPYRFFPELRLVEKIIKKTNDKESLELFNKLMMDYENAFLNYKTLLESFLGRIQSSWNNSYVPTLAEKELIACLLRMANSHGYKAIPLPKIKLSSEFPPLFVVYPELESEIRELGKPSEKRPHRNRPRPEWIDIEEVLGVYNPEKEEVTFFVLGILWASEQLNVEKRWLQAVVLIHELAHWLTHRLPGVACREWPIETYKLGSRELHETMAQLLTYWVAEEKSSGDFASFKDTFEKLNSRQSTPYRLYQRFQHEPQRSFFQALEFLRSLKTPAGLEEFERFLSFN